MDSICDVPVPQGPSSKLRPGLTHRFFTVAGPYLAFGTATKPTILAFGCAKVTPAARRRRDAKKANLASTPPSVPHHMVKAGLFLVISSRDWRAFKGRGGGGNPLGTYGRRGKKWRNRAARGGRHVRKEHLDVDPTYNP